MPTETEVLLEIASSLRWAVRLLAFLSVCALILTALSIRSHVLMRVGRCGGKAARIYDKIQKLMTDCRHSEALEAARQQIEQDPNDAYAHYLAGSAHYRLGDHDKCVELMRKAKELDPQLSRLTEAYLDRAPEGKQEGHSTL